MRSPLVLVLTLVSALCVVACDNGRSGPDSDEAAGGNGRPAAAIVDEFSAMLDTLPPNSVIVGSWDGRQVTLLETIAVTPASIATYASLGQWIEFERGSSLGCEAFPIVCVFCPPDRVYCTNVEIWFDLTGALVNAKEVEEEDR